MLLKYIFLCATLLLGVGFIFGQDSESEYYFIAFSDKINSEFKIENPASFLSQKSIANRQKNNIKIDETDLPVSSEYLTALEEISGVNLQYCLKWFNGVVVEVVNKQAHESLDVLPFVVEKKLIKSARNPNPRLNDKFARAEQRFSAADYGDGLQQIEMLCGLPLHQAGFDGSGVDIAVLDSGFENVETLSIFEQLRNDGRLKGKWDIVNGTTGEPTLHTHGSFVLSTMAGIMQDSLVGTAPGANYYLFRTEDPDSESLLEEYNWARAAEMCDSIGINVINSSLGYSRFDDPAMDHTYADMDGQTTPISLAANMAFDKGIFVVTSAGNSGTSDWYYITAPGDALGALTVGAVDRDEAHADFSSYGPSSDGRVKPDVVALGRESTISDLGIGIRRGNGTSFASPILCGMVASLWQSHPYLTHIELREAIREGSHLYTTPQDDLGYGIPCFWEINKNLEAAFNSKFILDSNISIYPNAFTDELNISLRNYLADKINVSIIDNSGKLVRDWEFSLPNQPFVTLTLENLQDLAAGTYVLVVGEYRSLVVKSMD